MDPNSTDPNNPNSPVPPASGGQPDLSASTLTANPLDQSFPAPSVTPPDTFAPPVSTPTDMSAMAPTDQSWSTLPQQSPPTDNSSSIWTPSPTSTYTNLNDLTPPPATSSLDNPFNTSSQPPITDGGLPSTSVPELPLTPPMVTPPPEPAFDNTQTPDFQSQFQPQPAATTPPPSQPEVPSWQPPVAPVVNPEPTLSQPTTTLNPQDIYTSSQPTSAQSGPEISTPQVPPEPAPTDLSHLIPDSPINEQPVYAPSVTQPETLIVPPDGNQVTPNIPTENNHSKIPKWIIGVGVGLLLIVAGATAYFIWPGFGQQATTADVVTTESLPATVPSVQQTAPTTPAINPISGTGSGFGSVDNSASSSAITPVATSAADLLRRRQQGQ